MSLPAFYPVVDSADWVARMTGAGAKLVQLRVKSTDEAFLAGQIATALATARAAGAILVVNDHWRLAIAAGADFLHLGQEDIDVADLAAIRRAGLRLGVSTHSEDELERALSVASDYVALGPIWPTTLKKMPWGPQGVDKLATWRARIGTLPLVAIGGITLDRASSCRAAGADSVAVVSDVTANPDPEARARDWITTLG